MVYTAGSGPARVTLPEKQKRTVPGHFFQPRSPMPRGHPLIFCGPVPSLGVGVHCVPRHPLVFIVHLLKQDPLSSGEGWGAAVGFRELPWQSLLTSMSLSGLVAIIVHILYSREEAGTCWKA